MTAYRADFRKLLLEAKTKRDGARLAGFPFPVYMLN